VGDVVTTTDVAVIVLVFATLAAVYYFDQKAKR